MKSDVYRLTLPAFRPGGHPTPNLIPNLKNPHPRSFRGGSQVRNHSWQKIRQKTSLRLKKNIFPRCVCFWESVCIKTMYKIKSAEHGWWHEMNSNIWGFPFAERSFSFASPPIGLSQSPMKLNVGVSAGQCGLESIYLHTSTGLVEERLWASLILVTLKGVLHQTWVNGLLMDTQRQVLFLLARALDKKPKATLDLKLQHLENTAGSGGASSDAFFNATLQLLGVQSWNVAVIQFKNSFFLFVFFKKTRWQCSR